MRNLNGYEINGRNLRVDFVDGKDKSGGSERKRHETGSHNGDSLEGPNANVTRLEANLDLGELLSFKTLQISIPSSTETQAVLLAPPPMMHQPPPMAGRMMQQPLRPSMGGSAVSSSGILGMAPPGCSVGYARSVSKSWWYAMECTTGAFGCSGDECRYDQQTRPCF
uniref:Chitin-binding type-1 domain-containing protein n=1 Tax=Peronospora matthiolae TaxID=2874970 RepID=A0AAV1TZ81_9STRA